MVSSARASTMTMATSGAGACPGSRTLPLLRPCGVLGLWLSLLLLFLMMCVTDTSLRGIGPFIAHRCDVCANGTLSKSAGTEASTSGKDQGMCFARACRERDGHR